MRTVATEVLHGAACFHDKMNGVSKFISNKSTTACNESIQIYSVVLNPSMVFLTSRSLYMVGIQVS